MTNPRAQENPASAHLFIINPLRSGGVAGLFRTHPPTAERVQRLMAMRPQGAVTATKRPWG